MEMKMNRAVFLDRDGVINKDVPYCQRPEDFELLPGVAEGIKLLAEGGFKIIVVTNQSVIARGYCTEEMLATIHDKMRGDLAKHGAHIDNIYYCPHHPDENCACRKPSPQMLFQAASHSNIDLRQSYVVGDNYIDIEMGRRAGCKTFLFNPAGADNREANGSAKPDYVVTSLVQAAQLIIADK